MGMLKWKVRGSWAPREEGGKLGIYSELLGLPTNGVCLSADPLYYLINSLLLCG